MKLLKLWRNEHRYTCFIRESGVDGWMDGGWTECVTAVYVRRVQ